MAAQPAASVRRIGIAARGAGGVRPCSRLSSAPSRLGPRSSINCLSVPYRVRGGDGGTRAWRGLPRGAGVVSPRERMRTLEGGANPERTIAQRPSHFDTSQHEPAGQTTCGGTRKQRPRSGIALDTEEVTEAYSGPRKTIFRTRRVATGDGPLSGRIGFAHSTYRKWTVERVLYHRVLSL